MDILAGLAMMAEMLPEFRSYRPSAIVAEFQRAMRRELDFGREQRNIQQFAHDFRDDPTVYIPRTYPEPLEPARADDGAAGRDQAVGAGAAGGGGHRRRGGRSPRRGHLPENDLRPRLLPRRSAPRQPAGDGGVPDRIVGFRHGRSDRRAAARRRERDARRPEQPRR